MYIYLLSNGEHYKIGKSKNPEKRVKQLNTGSSFKIELVYKFKSECFSEIECALHHTYSCYQINDNEWFNLPLCEVINFTENCRKIENNLIFLKNNKI